MSTAITLLPSHAFTSHAGTTLTYVFSTSQQTPRTSYNLKVQNCVHNRPSVLPAHNQMNQSHNLISYFLKINFNIILQSMSMSSKRPLPFRLSHQNPVSISLLPTHAKCRAHQKPCSATLMISGKVNKSQTFLRPSTRYTSSISAQLFSSAPCSRTSQSTLCSLLYARDQDSHPHKTREKIIFFF